MNSDFHTFLRTRRSIRRFKPEPIPLDALQRILETATYAPSAHNLQPWRFSVLTSSIAKSHLAETIAARFRRDMLADGTPGSEINARVERTICRANEAPAIIILCRDSLRVHAERDAFRQEAEAIMGIQSVAAASLQMLLAAHAEGLAGTWICWPLFAPQETRKALDLPSDWEPQGILFLGYPADSPLVPEKIPLDKIVRWN